MINWSAGQPPKDGLYWIHDSVNGVLFAMVVEQECDGFGLHKFYYIMGCDMGFPVDQLTHYSPVTAPSPPEGSSHITGIMPQE